MKKIDVLTWGIEHIAHNHKFGCYSGDSEDMDEVCIFGNNVPTLSDVKMLCEDLGLPAELISFSDYGIDVYIPSGEWREQDYEITGYEFWKTFDSVIGQ